MRVFLFNPMKVEFKMNSIMYRSGDCSQATLAQQADSLAQQKMTRLLWNPIDLIFAEIELESIGELQAVVKHLCHTCNRVVILGMQSEMTHLIVAKSSNISHLYANEILAKLAQDYGGRSYGDKSFAQGTFHRHDIIADLIDRAVESIVVALPYKKAF